MPYKKKAKKTTTTKRLPKIVSDYVGPQKVDYSSLKIGECFLLDEKLYQKVGLDQIGHCLNNGTEKHSLCGIQVEPVDVEIKWARRK